MPTLVAVMAAPRNTRAGAGAPGISSAAPPSEHQARHRADDGDEQRRWPNRRQVAHGQTEADLEQQQQHPDPRQDVEVRVRAEEAESRKAGQVPEQHAGHQLAQDRRLTEPRGQMPAGDRRQRDDGEGECKPAQFVEWTCRAAGTIPGTSRRSPSPALAPGHELNGGIVSRRLGICGRV